MKKLTIILLMLVYGLSSSGMSITIHYCMNDMVGWELLGKVSYTACGTCGMKTEGHKGCCHDEKKIIKSEKGQRKLEALINFIKSPVSLIDNNYSVYTQDYSPSTIKELPLSHTLPYKLKVPIFIYYCVFRI
jgi:hypothetical protein